jgi:hypothetical protein
MRVMKFESVRCPVFVEVVLGYVVADGDYNSVKLLKAEEADLIADGPGLRVYYQTVFGPRCRTAHQISVGPADSSRIYCFGVRTHPHANCRAS